MLIVLGIVFLVVGILGIYLINRSDDYEIQGIIGTVATVISAIVLAIVIGAVFVHVHALVEGRVVDELIEMHEMENRQIEQAISSLIEGYMEYESGVFTALAAQSPVVLINLYPELRAIYLVERQLTIHTENTQRIRELREQQINLSVSRWWLYFGR